MMGPKTLIIKAPTVSVDTFEPESLNMLCSLWKESQEL